MHKVMNVTPYIITDKRGLWACCVINGVRVRERLGGDESRMAHMHQRVTKARRERQKANAWLAGKRKTP